ncbi:eukaryotic translation initiation factor 2C, 2 [Rhizophlyctis rosea]|uniref:Eukaryotic translation initiation factor 2C, 2 n=1 Tax=Rhizophlyctis rosea TaxID=64517 RepID=A0AAD5X6Q3_9FUNG|nr:eukaryotic translation initiation factor 2C, 2 [Rhizophlyctis rosea]
MASGTSESELSSDFGKLSVQHVQFVQRPAVGRRGRMTKIRTNYVDVTSFPQGDVTHYDVSFTPDIPPVFIRRLFKAWEDKYISSKEVGNIHPVFDGRKNMFSAKPLPLGETHTFDVEEPEGDDEEEIARAHQQREAAQAAGRQTRGPRVFRMRVKKVATVNMAQLREFLAGRLPTTPYDAIMCLDIVLRHLPSFKYATVGRSFYTQAGAQSLQGGAEVWPGYHQSIRPAGGTMKINIDVSSTAFYEAGPLLNMVMKVLGIRQQDLGRGLDQRGTSKLEKTLKGLRVQTTHRGAAGAKRYRIAKMGDNANNTTFTNEQGVTESIAAYFHRVYGTPLQYPQLPLLIIGDPSKNMFMPMEVCNVVPGQRHTRKLNERQTAEMIKFTCQPPHVRSGKISQGLALFDYADNMYLNEFGLKVEDDLFIADARVMPAPTLEFGGRAARPETPRDGTWNLRNKNFLAPSSLKAWGVVCFMHERDCPPAVREKFVNELCNTCTQLGMQMQNRSPPVLYANPAGNVEGALKSAFMQAGNAVSSRPQMLLIVLPNTGVPLYAEIKRVSDTILGIPTQCVQYRHVNQAKSQYCQNVALKMNVKLGGMNLAVKDLPWVGQAPTIIIGADVTHPSPTEGKNKPSVAALVGSMDARMSKFAASVKVKPAANIYDEMSLMVIELLKNFYQVSSRKPERIVWYRDGVSEGQFGEVMTAEINAIRKACHRMERGYKPAITYIVVQKRHHTRFFPLERTDADRSGNVQPGTVVESGICHPTEFDYFLMSHPGLQGTSRPCHYNVLFDENNMGSEVATELTYKLAYVYARATRAVSIVTPAYYANIVASRARFHAKGEHWSDTESETSRGEANYASVKAELAKLM